MGDPVPLARKIARFFAAHPVPRPSQYSCPRGCFSNEEIGASPAPARFLLAGHVGAGKSTYIASLALAGAGSPDWYAFHTVDEAWERFRDFSHTGDVILPTPGRESHEPVVRVSDGPRPSDESYGNYGIYPAALGPANRSAVIMDMPGERFTAGFANLLNHAPSVQEAPMVILCVDPSHPMSATMTSGPLLKMAELREFGGHVAVVATKSDLHFASPDFPAELSRALPVGLPAAQCQATLQRHSDLARDFLQARSFRNVVSLAERFESSSFHLVSATSCSPQDGVYPRIEPLRVLDPFLYWELQMRGAHAA
jgi:hypothetical protein